MKVPVQVILLRMQLCAAAIQFVNDAINVFTKLLQVIAGQDSSSYCDVPVGRWSNQWPKVTTV